MGEKLICPIRQVVLKFDLSGCKIIWAWTTSEQVLMLSLVNDSCGINICKPCLCSVIWFCWFRWTITRCLESLSCVMNHEYVQYFDFAELIECRPGFGEFCVALQTLSTSTFWSVLWFSWLRWMRTNSWRDWDALWTHSMFSTLIFLI